LASVVCGAQVIAVEPDPHTVAVLRDNLKINAQKSNVEIVEAALGHNCGFVHFTMGRDTMNRVSHDRQEPTRMVRLRTMDDVIGDRHPRLIKMDVEGYEAAVVGGAKRTLANEALLAIITETADQGVCEPLQEAGFKRYYYDPFNRKLFAERAPGSPACQNSLFIRDLEEVQRRVAGAAKLRIAGVLL
jgi:FkbM family methyltransferase